MKGRSKMKNNNKRIMLSAGFATALSLSAFANVYDDADFVMDVRGDLNNDGKISAEEIGNAVIYRAGAKVSSCTAVVSPGSKENPSIMQTLATEVANPYWCEDTRPQNYVYFPQTSWWDASTSKLMCDSAVLRFDSEACQSDTVTVYSRFRWDGPVSTNVTGASSWEDYQVIVFNGENWTRQTGWTFGISSDNSKGAATKGSLRVSINSKNAYLQEVTKGVWYDAFVTLKRSGDSSTDVRGFQVYPRSPNAQGKYPWPRLSISATKTLALPLLVDATEKTLRVGSYSASTAGAVVVDRNGETSGRLFRGGIARVALWPRELTTAEMRSVSCGFYGAMWSLGATNGSANEFGADDYSADASTKAAPIKETFRPADDPIRVMRGKLTAEHPTLTLRGYLDEREVGMAKALVINPVLTDVGAECPVKVSLNDVEAGTIDLKTETALVIKKELWQRDADGEVELKITRTGAVAGALEIDSLLVGGAFQVGTANSASTDMDSEDFTPEQFFIGDTNVVRHARRAAIAMQATTSTHYSETNLYYYVDVPARLAEHCDFTYRTRVIVDAKWKNYDVALMLNGQTIWQNPGFVSYSDLDVKIPRGSFKTGLNELRWVMQSPCAESEIMYWINYDYHRLTLEKDWKTAPGLLLLLR